MQLPTKTRKGQKGIVIIFPFCPLRAFVANV